MTSLALGSGWLQIESGLALPAEAVAIGGAHGYAEIKTSAGVHHSMVHAVTNVSVEVPLVLGLAFNWSNGTLYMVTADSEIATNTPKDVAYLPDGTGILVAMLVGVGQLQLRKYNLTGTTLIHTWTPTVPSGYAAEPVKIDVACDSATVAITYSLRVVKRFSLTTGLDITDYETLTTNTPHFYGGVRWANREAGDLRDAVVEMTRTGHGPARALAIGSAGALWTDEVGIAGTAQYHLVKRLVSTGAFVASYITQANTATPTPLNDRTLSLATYHNPCAAGGRPPHNWINWLTG